MILNKGFYIGSQFCEFEAQIPAIGDVQIPTFSGEDISDGAEGTFH